MFGLALVLSLPAGVAAAASPQSYSPGSAQTSAAAARNNPAAHGTGAPGLGGLPSVVVDTVCAQWERIAAAVPVPSEPPEVCKLVNGWD
ncbi:hypothetical protein KBZ10_21790 [Streptomyces sp. F63]|uniref:hypothetical protein n=1 Tax=Streptomyces sp. F63 TaxID=2824887 RepID=UPI001B377F6F|nr:hypothetical protein [Streptomyces sp. F63]MBQ0987098.1 hypothetical protein [Streptomyces sp. F63]